MVHSRLTSIYGLNLIRIFGILLFTNSLSGCSQKLERKSLNWPEEIGAYEIQDRLTLVHVEGADSWGDYISEGPMAKDTLIGLIPDLRPLWGFKLIVNGVEVQERWTDEKNDAVATAYCHRTGTFDPGRLTIVYHKGSTRPDSIAMTFVRFHEYAHLYLEHATCAAGSGATIQRELAADIFATQLLCRLPGGIDVVRHSSEWFSGLNIPASDTHPPSQQRATVILTSCNPT